jgi:hypothetical protein
MPIGLRAADLATAFEAASDWDAYLASDADRAGAWRSTREGLSLTSDQTQLLGGFTRTMRVLVVSGIWCGDCVRQGPIAQAIADASPCIDLRLIDRDHDASPVAHLAINAGARVPVTVFMAEDFEPVSVFGDRTIHYYRHMAAQQFGASCPVPGAVLPDDVQAAVVQDWLDEFERVHLLLRLSGRLRQVHGD